MKSALVIADDLTGAAEIAGIGLRYGLPTRLLRGRPLQCERGLTVIDTDSRLLLPQQAAQKARQFVAGLNPGDFDLIYKKTDSVMRGPVHAELEAIMSATGKSAALLVPQNPSRGRTIRAGQYCINDAPLDRTAFADDPDHPARSANVLELLGGPGRCLEPGQEVPSSGISIGAACEAGDVRQWASQLAGHILPAGGADFFQAILEHGGLAPTRAFLTRLTEGSTLLVCGSASEYSHRLVAGADEHGLVVRDIAEDPASICAALREGSRAMIAICGPLDRTPGAGKRLLGQLSELVARVLDGLRVGNLLIEGGATASAVCWRLGWREFEILGELAPGVVQMRALPGGQCVVVKPGSYHWPDAVWHTSD